MIGLSKRKSSPKTVRAKPDVAADWVASLSLESLPSIAAIALQVVHAAGRRNCTSAEIVSLLGQDPVLSAKVMKAVNSCVYGLTYPVSSLDQAVLVLGLNPLRSLVLGLALPSVHSAPRTDDDTREFWLSSVGGGMLARELAIRHGGVSPEDDLVAGLLRNLGQLLLRQHFPDRWKAVYLGSDGRFPDTLVAAERHAFGCDHADLTARLLRQWNLPDEIVEPIRFHHAPAGLTGASPTLCQRAERLHFVELLTNLDELADDPVRLAKVLAVAEDDYGFTKRELVDFLESVEPKVTEFAALLDVDITKSSDYARILSVAAETLVGLTVAANREMLNVSASQTVRSEAPVGSSGRADTKPLAGGPSLFASSSGSKTPVPLTASSGRSVPPALAANPRYHVIAEIGNGGMGHVYRAEHRLMGRTVALKVVSPQFTSERETVERFRREVRLAARLHHPNIVTAYDADEIDGRQCLVMEFVDGASLDRVVAREGPLSPSAACRIVREVALGLQYAYEQGTVHRDIKPQNIILANDGHVKILDFGLARLSRPDEHAEAAHGLTARDNVVGTPDYMAPEQARDSTTVDHRADLYALGCTLFFLLTGRPPFNEGTARARMIAHVQDKPPRVRHFRNDIPIALQTLLDRLMEKNPDRRYQTAAELVAVLTPFTNDAVLPTVPAPVPPVPRGRFLRTMLLGVVLLGFLLAAAAGGAIAWSWYRDSTISLRRP